MLTCIVIDDEFGAIEVLSGFVERTPYLQLKETFRDSVEAVAFLQKEKVDLIFLDINMPNLSGMQFLDALKDPPMVIFCTAYKEFALESYDKNAIDYLLKPIEFERFLKATTKAMNSIEKKENAIPDSKNEDDSIVIKSGNKMHVLKFSEILFLEKQKHYVNFQTTKGSFLSRMNMNEITNFLPNEKFVRIHRSFIIALDQIEVIQSYQVLIGKYKIPIGASYREGFFKLFNPTGS